MTGMDGCPRQDELLDSLGRGYVGPELASHMDACPSCNEIHLVAAAFLEERVQAIREAAIPSAGTMRWRLQIRQQQEAQATARRSLLLGQALTLAIALALMVSLLGADVAVGLQEMFASIRLSTPLLVALGTWLLLGPIAGYVALRQK